MTERRKTDRRAGMVNVEVSETGTHKILDAKDNEIQRLEDMNKEAEYMLGEKMARIDKLQAEIQRLEADLDRYLDYKIMAEAKQAIK